MKKWMMLCWMVVGVVQVQGAMVHRYNFNDPNDQVGNANGILVNNTGNAKFENGQLVLGNVVGVQYSNANNGDYVDLPNGIISALGDQATIEIWTTWNGANMWERIFDLGTSDGGENTSPGAGGSYYIFMTPRGGAERLRFGWRRGPDANERVIDDSVLLPKNAEQHLVISWDGANQTVTMYRNGVAIPSGQPHFKLSDIPDNNNWLGRAQWNDPMYVGSYNELRIYSHAMSAGEVKASLVAGTEMSVASAIAPVNGQKEVARTPKLEWAQGFFPAGSTFLGYRLFLSKNQDAVTDGDTAALIGEMTSTSYQVPANLDTDSTYFWRVDEKYKKAGATDPNTVVGGVVSFDTVKTLPALTAQGSVFGILGSNLALNVNIVTASNIKSVAWYKYVDGTNDSLLSAGAKYVITSSNTLTTLTINSVAVEDGGKYYAKVENSAGTQASAQIEVMPRKGLAHRYSFTGIDGKITDPNMIDSVGGANGKLINNTGNARYENNMLVLGNTGSQNSNANPPFTNGDYVDLPNGIISALGNLATVEMWVTWGGPAFNYWQRIFDFGTSNGGENNSGGAGNAYYWMVTPWGGERMLRTGYRQGPTANERVIDDVSGALTIGRQTHVAVVWDGAAGTIRMYVDGKQIGQNSLHFKLSDMPDNNNWLGRAQWGDNLFVGRYNEFRIYDIPLSADTVLAHYQAGPNVVGADKPCTAYPAGDANSDCKVDLNDLAAMAANWLVCGGPMCQ